MSSNRCVIVVTHDSRVFEFGDRLARMVDGRILSVEETLHKQDIHTGAELCGKI